jgi:hypothetical protein
MIAEKISVSIYWEKIYFCNATCRYGLRYKLDSPALYKKTVDSLANILSVNV